MNITIEQLKQILDEQKKEVADYIMRNLTIYSWYQKIYPESEIVKEELKNACIKASYPNDYIILEKYK